MANNALSEFAVTTAHTLLDTLRERFQLKNDAALCRLLEVAPPVLSKIRGKRLDVGCTLMIRIHEAFGLSIKEIKALAAA